ncbi:MAG: DnaJ family molecular chaperone [Ilumatobacter sp.]
MTDPFTLLGLRSDATAADVRAARRDLARSHHPDAGGDASTMRQVNVAAADALRILAARGVDEATRADSGPVDTRDAPADTHSRRSESDDGWTTSQRDAPSFTVEALPVETFEALLIAAAELGEVVDDDPPYELRSLLADPLHCWCQLDVVPDAGASTVSVAIARADGAPVPPIVDVRNAWIEALNALDWSSL